MPATIETTTDGAVTLVRMDGGENRFNPETLGALEAELDRLDAAEGPRALVLTGTGKFFSNGLDLEWMQGAAEGEPQALVERVHALFARVLGAPYPTVGALNGHTFAAGAMLALALDERVMRADRGFFCLPEVDIGLPFTPGMSALCAARLSPPAAHRLMVLGERLGGVAAAEHGVVAAAVAEDEVVEAALSRARLLAPKAGATMGAIKGELYAGALAALRAASGAAAAAA